MVRPHGQVPGISEVYFEGLNTYANEAKIERLGVQEKAVDNALQRVKRKLERYLENRDGENKSEPIDRKGK